ncbi:hypothetical protein TrVFT333_007739 [Trichoderma virens FT-333]|nr:hypothetical protein TrVFT333_007739 [Trichoderma virens FT-333]
MFFLGTPHNGSSLAPILNKILRVLPLHSKRRYVSNLDTDNGLLSSLKLSFSQCVSGVSLYSFYESKPVHTGVWSVTIVKKSSAIMGIPGEEHAMLDANHMKMCKFKSRKDSNYQSVRNALRYRIKKILRDLSPNNDEDKWRAVRNGGSQESERVKDGYSTVPITDLIARAA